MKTSNRYGATVDVTPVLETHEVVVPAASASTDSAVLVTLSAAVGDRAENGLVLEWIGAQGIIPTDLRIIVDGKDWRRAVVPLPPSLTAQVGAIGEGDHGVQVELRNRRQSDVTVVLGVRGAANARTETLAGAALGTVLPDVGGRPAYYDRNPSSMSLYYNGVGVAPHGSTTRGSYTVPSGKRARVEFAASRVVRASEAAAAGTIESQTGYQLGANGTAIAFVRTTTNTVGDFAHDAKAAGVTLVPGDMALLSTSDGSTGGTVNYNLSERILEFDY
ncbi:MAG: hypothetical protein AB7L91_19060 [Dehalococcoidia bacterium]